MSKIQTKPSQLQRFVGWFRRHKATAVFSVLILALVLYLGGSWAVLQVQIHFERENFNTARIQLNSIYLQIVSSVGKPQLAQATNLCAYASAEIGRGARSCDVNQFLNYNNVLTPQMASSYANAIEKTIKNSHKVATYKELSLEDLESQFSFTEIKSDNFKFKQNKLNCGGDFYFSEGGNGVKDGFPPEFRDAVGLIVQLNCSGTAKAEYFPVSAD